MPVLGAQEIFHKRKGVNASVLTTGAAGNCALQIQIPLVTPDAEVLFSLLFRIKRTLLCYPKEPAHQSKTPAWALFHGLEIPEGI